jgi:nicotinamide-nucleotide amidase
MSAGGQTASPDLATWLGVAALVDQLAERLVQRGERLAVAESCTGGLLAAVFTDRPGSSRWFERGLVTYANEAKEALLGVSPQTLAGHGAVSEAVARQMAAGLLSRAPVQWTLSITGVAGPDGGTPDKPVGLVWMAWAHARPGASPPMVWSACAHEPGTRAQVRQATVARALRQLLQALESASPA